MVHTKKQAFTLIEIIVGLAIFVVLISATIALVSVLSTTTKTARKKTAISSLASYMEIVRNMPYSQVGTVQGNPNGLLPDYPNALTKSINGAQYLIYYKVSYVHDAADAATGTPDYKQVKMDIVNTGTGSDNTFVTTVTPQGLITNPNTGALQISVINAQGQPVSGASVEIQSPPTGPYTYDLHDITDSSGQITEVGLPPGVNSYRIIATKAGYSTDQTYPITGQNPNPTKPDATIVNGQVTQISFAIDQVSQLNIKTLTETCQPVSNININIAGAKLIGTSPNVVKFNQNQASQNGVISLSQLEWDSYTPQLLTGQNYIMRGTSPIQQISVLPGSTQTFTMILDSNIANNSLLAIVKDNSTKAALENAKVQLQSESDPSQVYTQYTGGSVWNQTDWSGGVGVVDWSTSTLTSYFSDDGHIDYVSSVSGIQLTQTGNAYSSTGWLESSGFDTGTNSTNYTILSWQPVSQSSSTAVQFQVAANNDDATWNFVGPDGTANTYYTTSGTDLGAQFDNERYVRYKAYLSSGNPSLTPVLTSVSLNFVTGCYTPGQVVFTGIPNGYYDLTASLPGYQTQSINSLNVQADQTLEVDMSQ